MPEYSFLLAAVSSLLGLMTRLIEVGRQRQFDFVIDRPGLGPVAIEVLSGPPSDKKVRALRDQVAHGVEKRQIVELVLVTPTSPDQNGLAKLSSSFANLPIKVLWLGVNDLPKYLGLSSPGDLTLPATLQHLQLQQLVGNLQKYRGAPIGPGPVPKPDDLPASLPQNFVPLTRQFSLSALSGLKQDQPLEQQLRLGEQIDNVTIVLSDIKNFSSLVAASRPSELTESMADYYFFAKECVFRHGGMLDKFIGDAVLAVFGYPHSVPDSSVKALRFAIELIGTGATVLSQWTSQLNAVVESGTRVGVATGDIWPLNIGAGALEITLLGDTINLAARLEKNASPNCLLMDNRTRVKAARADAAFIDGLSLTNVEVLPADAKGQQFAVRAWQHCVVLD
jgi:adenylate cyclase